MRRNGVFAVLLVLLVAAAAIGICGYAYNLGVAQGMAEAGKVVAPAPGAPPFAYGAPWGFYRSWGFGFGPLGSFFPFLLFLLFILLVRGVFWHGHGWGRGRQTLVPWRSEIFEEWHREAHGTPTPEPPAGQPRS